MSGRAINRSSLSFCIYIYTARATRRAGRCVDKVPLSRAMARNGRSCIVNCARLECAASLSRRRCRASLCARGYGRVCVYCICICTHMGVLIAAYNVSMRRRVRYTRAADTNDLACLRRHDSTWCRGDESELVVVCRWRLN